MWRERFADRTGTLTIVAETGGRLRGFAHTIIDHDPTWGTLVDNLHVAPSAKRAGLGAKLMMESARRLNGMASSPGMHLWVLQANRPARAFHERLGGRLIGWEMWHKAGSAHPTVRYSWAALTALALPTTLVHSNATNNEAPSRSTQGL